MSMPGNPTPHADDAPVLALRAALTRPGAIRFTAAERVTVARALDGRGPFSGPWAIPVAIGAGFATSVIGASLYAAVRIVPAWSIALRAELLFNVALMAEVLALLAGWLAYQRALGRDLRAALVAGDGALSPRLAHLLGFARLAPALVPLSALTGALATGVGYYALARARALEINVFPGVYRLLALFFAFSALLSLSLVVLGGVARLYRDVLRKALLVRVAAATEAAANAGFVDRTGGVH
jgi:hypothetical protein